MGTRENAHDVDVVEVAGTLCARIPLAGSVEGAVDARPGADERAARLDSLAERVERRHGRRPVDAGVRDALAVDEADGALGRDRLLACARRSQRGPRDDGGGDEPATRCDSIMTPIMFSAVAFSPSWRATSSATSTWRSCFFSELPCELRECGSARARRAGAKTAHQSIMTLGVSLALVSWATTAETCSAEKLGPELEPRRMTWHEGLPSVSTTGRGGPS